jgi:hypothetical protein
VPLRLIMVWIEVMAGLRASTFRRRIGSAAGGVLGRRSRPLAVWAGPAGDPQCESAAGRHLSRSATNTWAAMPTGVLLCAADRESADSPRGFAKDDYGACLKIDCDGVEVVKRIRNTRQDHPRQYRAHDAAAQRRGSRFGTHSQGSPLRDAILDR